MAASEHSPAPAIEAPANVAPQQSSASAGRLVVKNTLFLTAAQVLMIPISMEINGLMGRYLGPAEFGAIYFATTLCGFGFLAVEWGQPGVLPAAIPRDRAQAPALLGTSLAWRVALSVFVYAVLAIGCKLFGYDAQIQWALGLSFIAQILTSFANAFKDTIRGFERTDIPAYFQVGQQVLTALIIAPVLMLGGQMRAALGAGIAAVFVVVIALWFALRLVGIRRLSWDRSMLKSLLKEGTPFVFFSLAMVLQPIIDALYLSKLAPQEVMGWLAASKRLIGVLLFPASALLGALYPTLCRLFTEDPAEYTRIARGSLYSVALLVVPVALGCGLYPEIGISIFSRKSFGPAEDNLRISALFIFLVYFSMPLGICVLAAGKQRAWSIVQFLCVAVSLVLDPLLVPWFQKHMRNGGLGVCLATVISEVVVVACGVPLAPPGIFDRRFGKSVLLAVISGGVMALVARALHFITPFVAAPIAVLAYGAMLVLTGAIDKTHIASFRGAVARKLNRAR